MKSSLSNKFFIVNNSKYRFRYVCLIRLGNLADGVVAVLSLGFIGSSFKVDAHRLATGDTFKQMKKKMQKEAV